jgi:hypothetical protein
MYPVRTAKVDDVQACHRLQTIPGVGYEWPRSTERERGVLKGRRGERMRFQGAGRTVR